MPLLPSPGIILLIPYESTNTLVLSQETKGRILKGKVVAIGPDLLTDFGTKLQRKDYAMAGDICYFLSYEGGYDVIKEGSDIYYLVKFQDIRGIIHEK